MSALIKAGAAVLVLSGFAGGGYLIYDSTLKVVYPLSSLDGFATKYKNTTFGGKYGRYMLDPARNKNAWNEAYKRWSSS
ncbi:hypothetical protein, partial [Candidatus Mycoplasma haematohominis]|uniref:hypothetical protein n=1 Tax=Candidatus Mycoplasma haematohominis TaxID=1494318 RepID=UPI001C0A719C